MYDYIPYFSNMKELIQFLFKLYRMIQVWLSIEELVHEVYWSNNVHVNMDSISE